VQASIGRRVAVQPSGIKSLMAARAQQQQLAYNRNHEARKNNKYELREKRRPKEISYE
jgi:hypothetical protein